MPNILIVDDSAVERRMTEKILSTIPNLIPHYAINGEQALERLESQSIDVIVSDLKMPVMNGLELLEKVRCDFPSIPLIVMTSRGSEAAAVAALKGGAAGYIPKKELASTLVSIVNQVLAVSGKEEFYDILLDLMTSQQSYCRWNSGTCYWC